MPALATRLTKIENSLGADDLDRRIRSLSDDELDAEIAVLDAKARHCLEIRGVACADMDIHEVLRCLAEYEKQEAEHVDAA